MEIIRQPSTLSMEYIDFLERKITIAEQGLKYLARTKELENNTLARELVAEANYILLDMIEEEKKFYRKGLDNGISDD